MSFPQNPFGFGKKAAFKAAGPKNRKNCLQDSRFCCNQLKV
jgi:hypothetical protein